MVFGWPPKPCNAGSNPASPVDESNEIAFLCHMPPIKFAILEKEKSIIRMKEPVGISVTGSTADSDSTSRGSNPRSPVKRFGRKVLSRTSSQSQADLIANEYLKGHPDWDIAIEHTPIAISQWPWRVIRITELADDTPDLHPRAATLRRNMKGAFDYDY